MEDSQYLPITRTMYQTTDIFENYLRVKTSGIVLNEQHYTNLLKSRILNSYYYLIIYFLNSDKHRNNDTYCEIRCFAKY